MPTKEELVAAAREAGIEDADALTKEELQERLGAQAPEALGPPVPEPGGEPAPPEPSGDPSTGVQPVEEGDIPEAGR